MISTKEKKVFGSAKWKKEILANQVDLVEHVPLELEAVAGSHVLQKVDDLLPAAVLLVPKLIRREGEDGQVVRELLAQFIHLREVTDGCASQGGRVLHKNHLAFVFLHTDNLAVQGPGPDVMERH